MKTVSSALDHPPTAIGPHTSSAATTHAPPTPPPLPLPSDVVAADVDEVASVDPEVDIDVEVASEVWGLFDEEPMTSSLPESKLFWRENSNLLKKNSELACVRWKFSLAFFVRWEVENRKKK